MSLRRKVYIIGAGFSAGLGYPLTSNLLLGVWSRLDSDARKYLSKVIGFHYPQFEPRRRTSFPNIEQLLTKMKVNYDMFTMSRPAEGHFPKGDLLDIQTTLLYSIAEWFHELYEDVSDESWLRAIVERLKEEKAVIISFNWDLVLDHRIFSEITKKAYGLKRGSKDVVLLKPHGSLNWYEADKISAVKREKRIEIFPQKGDAKSVEAFLLARGISSKIGRRYMPLIVAPSYFKDFNKPIFEMLWQDCTDALSTASHVYFLGYSLPSDDMQAEFILRCGFHNQLHGRLKKDGSRARHTGAAKVIIVNPDQQAARRIESVVGSDIPCKWIGESIEKWSESTD